MYSFRINKTQDSITENAIEKGAKIVPPGTVLIAVRGMRLQKEVPIVEVQKESSFNQDLKACICKKNILSRFLFYFLRANEYNLRGACDEAAHGTKRLQTDQLLSIGINLPPLPTQKRIADILSKYDDLIDNNNCQIALLEESVHLLYREWFVRLRFPGHESVRVVDGVPEGWELQPLGAICKVTMGQSPESEFYNTNRQGLPFHQGVKNFGNRFVEHESYCTNYTRIAEPEDILCSVRAPVGRLNITLEKIVIGRGLSAIQNLAGYQSFQFYQLKSYFFKEDMIGGGAIFASVTKKQLLEQKMIVPNKVIIQKFEAIAKATDKQIVNLYTQNQKLKEARDLLLPRLMNGNLEV